MVYRTSKWVDLSMANCSTTRGYKDENWVFCHGGFATMAENPRFLGVNSTRFRDDPPATGDGIPTHGT